MNTTEWSLVKDLLQIISSSFVILGFPFAIWQLSEIAKSRNFEVFKSLFEGFHEEAAYKERNYILSKPITLGKMTDEDSVLFAKTTDFFQRMGFLSSRRFISRELLLSVYSGVIASMWHALRPYIIHVREETGLSNYAIDFERLTKDAEEYRKRKFPTSQPKDSAINVETKGKRTPKKVRR